MTGILPSTGGSIEGDDVRGILAAAPRAGAYSFFVPDATPPSISSALLLPADRALNVPDETNLTIVYTEGIRLGSGSITITQVASELSVEAVYEVIPITDTTRVQVLGNTLRINPRADLIPGKAYDVTLQHGILTDLVLPAENAGVPVNPSSALLHGNYTFMVVAKMRLQFSANVALSAGPGQFVFVEADTGITTTIPAKDTSQVTFTGTGVILRPILPTIASGREYVLIVGEYVLMDSTLGTHAGTVLDVYPDSPPFLLQFKPLLEE